MKHGFGPWLLAMTGHGLATISNSSRKPCATPIMVRPPDISVASTQARQFWFSLNQAERSECASVQQQNPTTERPWRGFGVRPRGGALPISPIRATTVSLQKAHSCDSHHIASATAVLASYLWIVPQYTVRSTFLQTLSPANAGPFFYRQFPGSPFPPQWQRPC